MAETIPKNTSGKDILMVIMRMILWLLTVFFVVATMVYFPAWYSFLFLLVAILIIPLQKWQNVLRKFIKGKVKAIVAIVLACVSFMMVPNNEIPDNQNQSGLVEESTVATETPEEYESTTEIFIEITEVSTEGPAEKPTEASTEESTEIATEASTEASTEESTEIATEETTEETTEDAGRDYILNTNTMRFHYPDCKSADKIKEENKAFFHGTREELIEDGYKSCGNCHP